jgi:hypothetical protein
VPLNIEGGGGGGGVGGGGGGGDIGIYGMTVLAYFSYGISLKKFQYYDIGNLAVHSICNFGLKNCGY